MAQGNNDMTVIGRDTRIKGEMFFESGAQILGTFEGKISSSGEVQIGAGATCQASIEAERVTVDGNIEGNIQANELLTLNADAHVQGDICAGKLIVAEGATFIGHCRVGTGATSDSSETKATRTAPSPTRVAPVKPVTEIKTPAPTRSASAAELEDETLTIDAA